MTVGTIIATYAFFLLAAAVLTGALFYLTGLCNWSLPGSEPLPVAWEPEPARKVFTATVCAYHPRLGFVLHTELLVMEKERLPGWYFDKVRDHFPLRTGWTDHRLQVTEVSRGTIETIKRSATNNLAVLFSEEFRGVGLRKEEA